MSVSFFRHLLTGCLRPFVYEKKGSLAMFVGNVTPVLWLKNISLIANEASLRSLFKNSKKTANSVYDFNISSKYRNPAIQILFSNLSLASRIHQFSSRSSSNLFLLFRSTSDKRISLFRLYSFKGIWSFSDREALGSSNS